MDINTLFSGLDQEGQGEQSPEKLREIYQERQQAGAAQAKKSQQQEKRSNVFDKVVIAIIRELLASKKEKNTLSFLLSMIEYGLPSESIAYCVEHKFRHHMSNMESFLNKEYVSPYPFPSELLGLKTYLSNIEYSATHNDQKEYFLEAIINAQTWTVKQDIIAAITTFSLEISPSKSYEIRKAHIETYYSWLYTNLSNG